MAGIPLASGFNRTSASPVDLYSTVADASARDAIPDGVRYLGMTVFVEDADGAGNPETYQLKTGKTDSDWEVFGVFGAAPSSGGLGDATTVAVNTTYTAADAGVKLIDASGGARTLTLPLASTAQNLYFTFTKLDNTLNVVTIDGNGSETIDSVPVFYLTKKNQSVTMLCDGSAWYTVIRPDIQQVGPEFLYQENFETSQLAHFTFTNLGAIETSNPLNGDKSVYIIPSVGTPSTVQSPNIETFLKFSSVQMTIVLDVFSASTAGNVSVLVYDVTNSANIVSQVLKYNGTSVTKNTVSFVMPSTCASIYWKVTAAAESGSPITIIDDVSIMRSLPLPAVAVSALDIDWLTGNIFWKDVAANSTFTFSNIADGKVITVAVKNTSGGTITLTLPTIVKDSTFLATVAAGKENVYTFFRANSKTYASCIAGLS